MLLQSAGILTGKGVNLHLEWKSPLQNVTPKRAKHTRIKSSNTITFASSGRERINPPIIFLRFGSFDIDRRGRRTRKLRSMVKLGAFGSRPRILTTTIQKSKTFHPSRRYACFPLYTP
jgi:hypothetical protein